jgi:ribonuclease III
MAQVSLEQLQERIGYKFRKLDLLLEALTHSSFAREASSPTRDNELMEFLGDAVLSFLVTVRLVEAFPEFDEGKLSRARAGLVAATHLQKVAAELDLGKFLRLGPSEERTGGREKTGLLVNAMEAVIAAIYRDGGIEPAGAFIEQFVIPAHLDGDAEEFSAANYKGTLQEHLQAQRQGPVHYRIVEEAGAEHRKVFTVEVRAAGHIIGRGTGWTKKAAEQEAARAALQQMSERSDG